MARLSTKHFDEYRNIGLAIAYYRKIEGLTQLSLAEKVGISRQHLSSIEAPNEFHPPSLELLLTIAETLKIPAYLLLKFPGE